MSKISYSAVVLDDRSRERLLKKFGEFIPDGWEIIGDPNNPDYDPVFDHFHMTINMGEIKPELEKYLGLPVPLSVVSFAQDDKVIAVGVTGFESANAHPHITLAVNRVAGAKPYMSNNLQRWDHINKSLRVVGKVTEIPQRGYNPKPAHIKPNYLPDPNKK